MTTKTKIEIEVTPGMLAEGLRALVDSGVLDQGADKELPTVPMKRWWRTFTELWYQAAIRLYM